MLHWNRPQRLRSALLAAALLGAATPAVAITGVCPDGSIFIVQDVEAIPCPAAKRVDPNDVPPLNPEFLPRPYGWERFNRESDPYNPYNVIDTVRPAHGGAVAPEPSPPGVGHAGTDPRSALRSAAGPVSAAGAGPPPAPAPPLPPYVAPAARGLDLALAAQDVRDLATIVELMQQRAPATVVKREHVDASPTVLRLARSPAFEERLRDALARRGTPAGGPVVLFSAEAGGRDAFYANLTFVQGHVAFHPDTDDPAQFGVLDGRLGDLDPSDRVLGYAVLPANVDPARPLDIYWDDRLLTATLHP